MAVFVVRNSFNQKFLYTVSIDSSDGFQLCPADGCQIGQKPAQLETSDKFQITEPLPASQRQAYETFLAQAGIDVAAIEWVESEAGQIYVYDVNTNTNYNPTAEDKSRNFCSSALGRISKERAGSILSRINLKQTKAFRLGGFLFFFISKYDICHFVFMTNV